MPDDPFEDPHYEFQPVRATPIPGQCTIYPGMEGLMDIIRDEYEVLSHGGTHRRIPESLYAYYGAILTLTRVLEVSAKNGVLLSPTELQIIDRCRELRPPKILGAYIQGFGDTHFNKGYQSVIMKYARPPVANSRDTTVYGYWGKIGDVPHIYASYPCSAVFALRVIKDIFHTQGGPSVWNLPADLAFYRDERLVPLTPACIGYAPARRLDPDQLSMLAQLGIGERFPTLIDSYSFSFETLLEVQRWINEVPNIVTVPRLPCNTGTTGQLLLTKIVEPNVSINSAQFQSFSSSRLGPGSEYAGGAFKYRMIKSPTGTGSTLLKKMLMPYEIVTAIEFPVAMNWLRDREAHPILSVWNGLSSAFITRQRIENFVPHDQKM